MSIHTKQHIIWTNDLNFKDWEDDLREEHPDASDDELYDIMYEENSMLLDDERENLSITLNENIVIFADIGRWNGRSRAAAEITSGNIADCLHSELDTLTWFLDENGDLICEAHHHDGVNYYMYRVYKPTASETSRDNLKWKYLNGQELRKDITRVTSRLGDYISKVYGWNISKRGSKRAKVVV